MCTCLSDHLFRGTENHIYIVIRCSVQAGSCYPSSHVAHGPGQLAKCSEANHSQGFNLGGEQLGIGWGVYMSMQDGVDGGVEGMGSSGSTRRLRRRIVNRGLRVRFW
jgi:hypothetical protein